MKVLLGRLGINHHSHVFTGLNTGLPSLIRLWWRLEAHTKIDVARLTVTCLGRGEDVCVYRFDRRGLANEAQVR